MIIFKSFFGGILAITFSKLGVGSAGNYRNPPAEPALPLATLGRRGIEFDNDSSGLAHGTVVRHHFS